MALDEPLAGGTNTADKESAEGRVQVEESSAQMPWMWIVVAGVAVVIVAVVACSIVGKKLG